MKEPIQHIHTFQSINKPIALELYWMIERIKKKLTTDQLEKLKNLADLALLKEIYKV